MPVGLTAGEITNVGEIPARRVHAFQMAVQPGTAQKSPR